MIWLNDKCFKTAMVILNINTKHCICVTLLSICAFQIIVELRLCGNPHIGSTLQVNDDIKQNKLKHSYYKSK